MNDLVKKPLGQVLAQAGLISDFQIRKALDIQSKDDQVRFGTILVSQGILKQKTVEFFAEELPALSQESEIQPLGYYLQEAALINKQQIEILVEEQKQTGMLWGELVLQKGWLKKKTINFFLKYLGEKERNLDFLSPSNRAIIKYLHLENKAASPYSLLKEVFEWTGGHHFLTQQICQIISNANYFIPAGMEASYVDNLVQDYVVNDWENQALGEYLKTIQDYLLRNTICLPEMLLRLYLQILQQGEVITNHNREKKELMKLGLVIEKKNKLRISNRLYQLVFNQDWVKNQLLSLEKRTQTSFNKAIETTSKPQNLTPIPIKNEPLTQIAALVGVLGLLLISPLVIFYSNSRHQISQKNNGIDSQSLSSLSKSTLCMETIPADKATQEDWRVRLKQEQKKLQKQFPDNCQHNLDKLIILEALNLGKENRVLDAIQDLCLISTTSESFNQAKFWLSRWYNSADWGEQTQSYLSSINDCPAAEKSSAQF